LRVRFNEMPLTPERIVATLRAAVRSQRWPRRLTKPRRPPGAYPRREMGAGFLPTKQPPKLTDVTTSNRTKAIDFMAQAPRMMVEARRLW